MRRREFIAGISAAAWPLAAQTQHSDKRVAAADAVDSNCAGGRGRCVPLAWSPAYPIERTTGFANNFVSFGAKWLVAAHVVADLVVRDCEM
jgi:hypothetical protein